MASVKVKPKQATVWDFKTPVGTRIIHTNGFGHVKFQIESGKEQALLVQLQEFLLECSVALGDKKKAERLALANATQEEFTGEIVDTKPDVA